MQVNGIVRDVCLWGLFTGGVATAAPQTYVYAVEHPTYGKIGSYTETIDADGGVTRINSHLQIAVKVIGIVVYRHVESASQLWRGPQLESLRTATEINGARMEVSGALGQRGFVVTSAAGTETAPPEVKPSDPWTLRGLGSGVLVSTRSGLIESVNVTGGEAASIIIEGTRLATRHFRVDSATQPDRFDIWLDDNGVPVQFRTRERSGDLVSFIMVSPEPQADALAAPFAPPRPPRGRGAG